MLGQGDVDQKPNEVPMINDLLDPFDIADAVASVDALHTETESRGSRRHCRNRMGIGLML